MLEKYWLNIDRPLQTRTLHVAEGCSDVRARGRGAYKPEGAIGRDGGWMSCTSIKSAFDASAIYPNYHRLTFCKRCQSSSLEFQSIAIELLGNSAAPLNIVLETYQDTRRRLRTVPADNSEPSIHAVMTELPQLVRSLIESRSDQHRYHVTGSVGEYPLNMASVPWVAVFHESVTKSARRGYYIVLLFSEDGSAATLSLNQGFYDFQEEFRGKAEQKARHSADFAAQLLICPSGFKDGAISLSTTGTLGRGYEQGSIYSTRYEANEQLSVHQFALDLGAMLDCYEQLIRVAGRRLSSLISVPSEPEFQAAVQRNAPADVTPPQTVAPQPRPPVRSYQGRATYVRNAAIAARALQSAGYKCALASESAPHETFLVSTGNHAYVEAHHLIPMSQQPHYAYSLDVEENILPLCPNCHRMLHHGKLGSRRPALSILLAPRAEKLELRGLRVDLQTLIHYYARLGEED